MQKLSNVTERRKEQLINVAVAVAGGWLIWYLSGPYAAEAGRNLYEFVYDKLWGTPHWFSARFFERAFYYVPNRGHIGNWFYHCAEYAGPIIASPVLYKVPDFFRSLFKWGKRTSNQEEHIDLEAGEGDVKTLTAYFDKLNSHTVGIQADDYQVAFIPSRNLTQPPTAKKFVDMAKRNSLPLMRL
ncbi:MAG: hypothetical protein JSR17_12325 [Proteobacteria bacterium]|nr:hypothetical protein [Pseudomonadota bacterium]